MNGHYYPHEMQHPPRLPEGPAGGVEPGLVLLINPFYPKDPRTSFGKHALTPSLALTSVAGATPPDWRVVYWDENLLQGPPPADPMPEVVGLTVHLTFARRAYALAAWYRQRGARVILGGPHVQSLPEEAAPHADAICLGDGTAVWPDFLQDVRERRIQPVYRGDYQRSFDEAPPVRRDILPAESFLTAQSMIATRGCNNRCGFCHMATAGLKMPYQMRTTDRIAEELRASGEPYAVFLDNNLGADRAYLAELCRALQPLSIIWSAAVTLDVSDDPDLVRVMALSGCTGVFIGFETLSAENLRSMGKRTPDPGDYLRRVRIFQDVGIHVNGSFVFGFDGDGSEVFEQTVDWIETARLECATFHILTPYPGTPLYRRMEAEGRLLHRDWGLYDTAHAVFRPLGMTAAQLEAGYAYAYGRLFSLASIWKRRPEAASEAAPYLAMTLLYKKANRLWKWLIKRQYTRRIWRPMVLLSRFRHLKYRRHLAAGPATQPCAMAWRRAGA